MKKVLFIMFAYLFSAVAIGQQTGYYNGTEGKSGDELKASLNEIISDHMVWSYFFSKKTFKLSDADPNNSNNVIQVYTGFSHDNDDYGTSGLTLNREHVWAKSHGNFTDILPMYSDVHNLKPSASTVNQSKSNLDFDNGGEQHAVATECYYSDTTWEARDAVKGDIARIIFYMSTRYEGNDGEIDLEVVDHNHTYPLPEHGRLSTLLQWNQMDPPDEFERNRNNVIYTFQQNRNPFIDDPGLADLIWGDATPNTIRFGNIQMMPQTVFGEEPVAISATITATTEPVTSATLQWGLSYESLTNEIEMTVNGENFSAQIPSQAQGATVYYSISATNTETTSNSVVYSYYVNKVFSGTLVSIYDIQGQQEISPYEGQIVSTSGVVTGNFGDYYFVQDGTGGWNGLLVYELGRNPQVGDSIIITGKIAEYAGGGCSEGKTEMIDLTDYYFVSSNNPLPEPVVVQAGYITEEHESIITKVYNATCTDANYQADFYMWKVNDGSGTLKVHNTAVFEYDPTEGLAYNITGPMNWDYCEWKIELRSEEDVAAGTDDEGPSVVDVTPVISTNVKVTFNEFVDPTTAEDITNYSVNNGIIVEEVSQHSINKSLVFLTVSEMSGDYELTIENVEDEAGNVMESQTFDFSFVGIEDLFANGEVKVFPNPADQQLNIAFNALKQMDLTIQLVDVSGRMVKQIVHSGVTGSSRFVVDVDDVSKGIYFLNLQANDYNLRYKIIVD